MNGDGSGTAVSLNFPGGGSGTFALTLSGRIQFYMVEATRYCQLWSLLGRVKTGYHCISSVPSGTFVFRMHTLSNAQVVSEAGGFTVANGSVTGNVDRTTGPRV